MPAVITNLVSQVDTFTGNIFPLTATIVGFGIAVSLAKMLKRK